MISTCPDSPAAARAASPPHPLDAHIRAAVDEYYTRYYRDQLALPDWREHVTKRHREDENFRGILERIEREVIGRTIGPPCRVLVVGGGTGADYNAFSMRGCETCAIEPNRDAVAIAHMKAERLGIRADRFITGIAESLPYPDESFDFVWSWTVIEHVQNV